MAIVNRVSRTLPGYGSGTTYSNLAAATNAGATTNVVLNVFSPPLNAGKIRVQSLSVGVNATIQLINITGTDGTNTVQLYDGDRAATPNGLNYVNEIEFITDFNLTQINVAVAVVNNNSTMDVEVCGN